MIFTAANGVATFALSVGLMLGAPFVASKAAEPDSTGSQSVKHKKPNTTSTSTSNGTPADSPGSGAQTDGKHAHTYAKRGNCSGCGETALPYPVRNASAVHAPNKPRQAKTTLPKDWPSPDNCKYVMPDDKNWEAEKTACNQAGYPTPWSDKETSSAPAPAPTPDDRSLGEKIRDAVDVSGHIQSEYDRAHGLQSAPCPNDTSNAQDLASGCHQ